AGIEGPFRRRCARQRPPRQFFCERRTRHRRGHARADFRRAPARARTLRRRTGRRSDRVEGIMSAEPDYLPADALAEEEPKYLRRQKPVEIRKRKFSRKTWPLYRRVFVGGVATLAAGLVVYQVSRYFLYSESVLLERPDQIEITGNRFVAPDAIVE